MNSALDTLYKKIVPTQVQSYISLMNGETVAGGKKSKSKKQKPEKVDDHAAAPSLAIEQYPNRE